MAHRGRYSYSSTGLSSRSDAVLTEFIDVADLEWPFQRIDSFPHDDLRETAYEILVMCCRSSPGFGGRVPLTYHSSHGTSTSDEVMPASSKIKKALGLQTKRTSPTNVVSKRPVTLANVMRQQMMAAELTDHRIRKTVMRTLVGQTDRKLETVILPLELLRHLNSSEFSDIHEYQLWQKRQLKILQLGLLDHPSNPIEESDSSCILLREIIQSAESKPIDTSKKSDTMCTLHRCVMALAWRGNTESCHWIDGFPINVHIYIVLLQTIFDRQEETFVLDEIGDMLDLMMKTWDVLGIVKPIHNVCFAWVLFQQFVATGETEQDLLCATQVVLTEISNENKRGGGIERRDPVYGKVLSSVLTSMQGWVEKKVLDYHGRFGMQNDLKLIENLLSLSVTAAEINHRIHGEYSDSLENNGSENGSEMDVSENYVDYYIRSSLRNAFKKVTEEKKTAGSVQSSEYLIELANDIEKLALKEEECFSVILKKYHPIPAGVAAATLHCCYNDALKKYVSGEMKLSPDTIKVLQTAGKLENLLIQMVVDDSADCSDGGKSVVQEMVPYEVESIILGLIRTWMDNKLEIGRECLNKAKDGETWGAISKEEKHARSAVELITILRKAVNDLFEIPVAVPAELAKEFAQALEGLIKEYATFVGTCGTKRSYIPKLPPLTRCNKETRFRNVWRRVHPCRSAVLTTINATEKLESNHPRPSTSRGTRRLYVRLNTLHYLSCKLHLFEHSLSLHNHQTSSTKDIDDTVLTRPRQRRRNSVPALSYSTHRFDIARTAIQAAIKHVAEVAAARLIFFDSKHSFHEAVYIHDAANARIRPALRTLKQNLTLLNNVTVEKAQPLLIREVMKASFDAFLLVLLAGGNERAFSRADHGMVVEDFDGLKRVFATCGDGILEEELVNQEAEEVEGIIALMDLPTEQLINDFSLIACEANGIIGLGGSGLLKVPMPPATGRWKSTDPNTLLRVLCYRNDDVSDRFLKKTFQLPKRR